MRKLCYVLTALLLAVPAIAAIDVNCGPTSNSLEAEVLYQMTAGDTNLPRAFGLDITVDNGATIDSLGNESSDFWVHPGRIVITDGNLISEGNSLAVGGSTGALGGLDTNGITVEMGSLYASGDANHPNAPPSSGVLFTFTVSGDCNVTISGNAARGNVVLESTAEATVNYSGCHIGVADCYTGPDYAEWVNVGKPDSWCTANQCHGDADGIKNPVGHGSFWVADPDIVILLSGYKQAYSDPVTDPWISADFNHTNDAVGHGHFRVSDADIAVLLWYYKDTHVPPGDCQSSTPASP
jgi:hypothetical protein